MTIRKIDLMHQLFGRNDNLCRDCSHYTRYRYRDKPYRKCDVYGVTQSEASDWKASYHSCGLFNREYEGQGIIRLVTPERKKEVDNEPLEGQVDMFGGDAECRDKKV